VIARLYNKDDDKDVFVRIASSIARLENLFAENAVYTCGNRQLCDIIQLFGKLNY